MMISLQKSLKEQANTFNAREKQFLRHSLNYLASTSRERGLFEPESWSVTSFDVEFGDKIGDGGL